MNKALKLGIAVGIMYTCFIVHFTFHESLLPKKNATEENFHFPNALLFILDICNTLAALVVILIQGIKLPKNVLPFLAISIPQQVGLACSNYAMNYVDYPTFSVLKAAKPITVMLCQLFLFRKKISTQRILVVVILSVGLAIFGINGNFGKSSGFGIALAFGSLVCDAVYVPMVDKLKVGSGGAFVTMLYSYMWSTIIIFILRFKEIFEAFSWIAAHQDIITRLLAYGLTGSLAHIALFAAIGMSDGLIVSIATTTRKFFTIVLSSVIFRHKLRPLQWIGVVVIFFALGIEIAGKKGKKPEKPQEEKIETEKQS